MGGGGLLWLSAPTIIFAISAEQEPFHSQHPPRSRRLAPPYSVNEHEVTVVVPSCDLAEQIAFVQLRRQDGETPKGRVVSAEEHDEVSAPGSGP